MHVDYLSSIDYYSKVQQNSAGMYPSHDVTSNYCTCYVRVKRPITCTVLIMVDNSLHYNYYASNYGQAWWFKLDSACQPGCAYTLVYMYKVYWCKYCIKSSYSSKCLHAIAAQNFNEAL